MQSQPGETDMALFEGVGGDDLIVGGEESDSVFYLPASDGVTVDLGISGPQDIGGGMGTDTLVSIENIVGSDHGDVLTGNAEVNQLLGMGGDDMLAGGGGDDMLAGGNGADTFKYSFSGTGGTGQSDSFTGWLDAQGLASSGWSQNFFASNYTAWLQHLVEDFGIGRDANGDGKVTVSINQNSETGTPTIEGLSAEELAELFGDRQSVDVATGKKTQERWFSDSFSMGGGEAALASADGHDTIVDYAWGTDQLQLDGLEGMTLEEFKSAFNVEDSGADTELALADGTWSVTLMGITGRGEDDFYDGIFA
jgi:Ca2+-binding RTX toxin-like protein